MLNKLLNSEQKELTNSIIRLIAIAEPTINVGLEFFEYRNRVKQNRINKFIELLQGYLETSGLNKKIDFDLLNEEEFTDLFEAVFIRVSRTRAIEKLDRFKLILAKKLTSQSSIDYVDSFLDLVTDLKEKQIEILQAHYEIFKKLEGEDLLGMNNSIELQLKAENEKRTKGEENNYKNIKDKLKEFRKFRKAATYNITDGEYRFFIQDLTAKSLLTDFGIGGIGTAPYDLMEITEYGKQFLEFMEVA